MNINRVLLEDILNESLAKEFRDLPKEAKKHIIHAAGGAEAKVNRSNKMTSDMTSEHTKNGIVIVRDHKGNHVATVNHTPYGSTVVHKNGESHIFDRGHQADSHLKDLIHKHAQETGAKHISDFTAHVVENGTGARRAKQDAREKRAYNPAHDKLVHNAEIAGRNANYAHGASVDDSDEAGEVAAKSKAAQLTAIHYKNKTEIKNRKFGQSTGHFKNIAKTNEAKAKQYKDEYKNMTRIHKETNEANKRRSFFEDYSYYTNLLENIVNENLFEDEEHKAALDKLRDYQHRTAKEHADRLHEIMTNIGNSYHSNDGSYQKHREELERHLKRIARHHDEQHHGLVNANQEKLKREGKW